MSASLKTSMHMKGNFIIRSAHLIEGSRLKLIEDRIIEHQSVFFA